MRGHLHGYATDIPYLRDFKPQLAPAWLDHVALVAGVEPPVRSTGFAWCDLGCGQGVTANVLAAGHPLGDFHGIDAMPAHIDHARRLAAEAAIPNVAFHCVDFAAASNLNLPQFDYIVVHGVYSWVGPETQHALRRFIDRRLKSGGLVYVSYNAMPGWAADLPFQRLAVELSRSFPGHSADRFAAALETIRTLAADGLPALAPSFILREIEQRPEDYTSAYLVHEFMPAAWQPLYVTDVRAAMQTIGLAPVGSATLSENLDRLVLGANARAVLGGIADDDLCELVRDYYLDQRFRRDVFARAKRQLDRAQRRDRLLTSSFALARPAGAIRYVIVTPEGPYSYDSPAARAIIAALAAGRRAVGSDLSALLTLCAAGDIMPVEPGHASVGDLNRVLCDRVDGPEEIRWLALPCGTAVEADPALLRALRDGHPIDGERFPEWTRFLASHGL